MPVLNYAELIGFYINQIKHDYKAKLGALESYRKEFVRNYKRFEAEIGLKNLPEEKKRGLWNESLTYCPSDRLSWCEAVRFFEIATELQK